MRVDRVVQRVQPQRLASLALEGTERFGPCGAAIQVFAAEMLEQRREHRQLRLRDARVVDAVDATQPLELALEVSGSTMRARLGALRELRQRFDGDVQHVQEVPRTTDCRD